MEVRETSLGGEKKRKTYKVDVPLMDWAMHWSRRGVPVRMGHTWVVMWSSVLHKALMDGPLKKRVTQSKTVT